MRRLITIAARRRSGLPALALVLGLSVGGSALAAPGKAFDLDDAVDRINDIESVLVAAEEAANFEPEPTEEELAKRVFNGQLMLHEDNVENAAIVFLDVLENHPGSMAASQAMYFLGEALVRLEMDRWAAECFTNNLIDNSEDGRRYHQRSMAGLLDLSVPRRQGGFARRPGLSATPEVRARLQAIGINVEVTPPEGKIDPAIATRIALAIESIAPDERELPLRYAYGRWLYFEGQHEQAMINLDSISPVDVPITTGPGGEWRIRAAYFAATASLAMGSIDDALARFQLMTVATPIKDRDKRIVELAWLAQARIHHDQNETDMAVRAYRRISRDSPFFPEAMYETAWTLLRAGSYDRALQALDLLLVYDPNSPIVPEIKQLRGKVKIQMRDWQEAENEFLALRREFDDLAKRLGRQLEAKADAADYFSAVAAEDMLHFSLGAVMPVEAVPVAETLPRAVETVDLANELGEVELMLFETRALLAKMEAAVEAKERARLFTDLGAHLSSLDSIDLEILELKERMLARSRRQVRGSGVADIEAQRKALRDRVDNPLGDGSSRDDTGKNLRDRAEELHHLDLTVQALRAQLIATERYYEQTRKDQRIDPEGFLTEAAALRDEVAELERTVAELEAEVERAQTTMRFDDPWTDAQRAAVQAYTEFLDTAFAAILEAKPDADAQKIWSRADSLHTRVAEDRGRLDNAAGRRLERAIQILREERVNLDAYKVELNEKKGEGRVLIGEVMQASYRDSVGELANLVTRSEVGLLDVAWAIQEMEAEEIRRLEQTRDRDMRELDRVIEQAMEDER